jgi:hypothetical protein
VFGVLISPQFLSVKSSASRHGGDEFRVHKSYFSFISARGSATNVLPTLLVIVTQLKAEAFYLEKCKTTSKAFHFLHEEVKFEFLISRWKNERIILRCDIELASYRDS